MMNQIVNNACSNFANVFLTIAKECIPTREVTIRTDDKMWFDSNLRRESRRRDKKKLFENLNCFCRKILQKATT